MLNLSRRQFLKSAALFSAAAGCGCNTTYVSSKSFPNIIFIMADDMGYGDPGCYNPESKTPTPNIDRFAQQGLQFTHAHSPGTLCVPARYGLLTGRYPFREEMSKHRIAPLIEPERMTIASVLKKNGYRTACIGKWHLGFHNISDPDYDQPLRGGPVDLGFDTFFGMHASLDIPPYYYIENDQVVQAPTDSIKASHTGWVTPVQGKFWRQGKIAPDFDHDNVLPDFADKAISFIQQQDENHPFFLYLALAAPHTPWLPSEKFEGTSEAGLYGDFIHMVDFYVGKVLQELEKQGLADNSLVIFTSDNGPVWYEHDIEKYGHDSTTFLKGMKADAYEGGHRMPFIARWPGHIKPATCTDEVISFTDMLATFAAIVDEELPENAGEDSYNILPVLLGQDYDKPLRQATVIEDRAIIQWPWKLILGSGYGNLHVRYSEKLQAEKRAEENIGGGLFNLQDDPLETRNLYDQHPEKVKRLTRLLESYRSRGYSVMR
ncbi:sulfatase-like hydrolase/transferase [candidate division KSB1 bacterium]|nr:sulfatase-like hydrolase/transferase [candidate division KSB1 bacterium]